MWGPYRRPLGRPWSMSIYAIVRITATGDGFLQTERLYFIDEPTITTQGILATHITVRSPIAEATATVTPAPPAENTIERLVKIRENYNAAMCQAVAEELLSIWGREQLSIVGRVPLVVTLRFKEYAKVFVPSINLDDELILQRKEHNLETFETTVTLGDIIMSEGDLLSRIIEELIKEG
jgi:hypothetical protein